MKFSFYTSYVISMRYGRNQIVLWFLRLLNVALAYVGVNVTPTNTSSALDWKGTKKWGSISTPLLVALWILESAIWLRQTCEFSIYLSEFKADVSKNKHSKRGELETIAAGSLLFRPHLFSGNGVGDMMDVDRSTHAVMVWNKVLR